MEIKTARFGKLEIDAKSILDFPNGIPGFEKCNKFKLFHNENANTDSGKSLFWLQSLDDPDLTFQAIDPVEFGFNFEFDLTDEESGLLKLEDTTDVAMLLLVSKLEDQNHGKPSIKAHMTTPIVINLKSSIGFQKILKDINYDLSYNLSIKSNK